MKAIIVVLLCAAFHVCAAAERFALEVYRLVPAPKDRPAEARLILKIVNDSDQPLYFASHSLTSPLVTTERKKKDVWLADQRAVCGVGIEEHVVMPRSYVVFEGVDVFHPPPLGDASEPGPMKPEFPKEPIRFRFTCYRDREGKRPVEFISREFLPQEFVKP